VDIREPAGHRERAPTLEPAGSQVRLGSLEHLVRLERPGQKVRQDTLVSQAFQGRLERAATPVRRRHLGSAVIQAIRERRE